MKHELSKKAFVEACAVLPGGVDSPVRSFQKVLDSPIFVKKAQGCKLWDLDDNEYIDYIGSWGPMILGHANPYVFENVMEEMQKGISYGLPNVNETKLGNLIVDAYPACEMVRFVTSGTEATMSAIRVARGYTKKDKIVKFAGCYHGHSDSLLVKAGSGALSFASPDSAGVPQSMIADTLICRYNDIDSVSAMFQIYGKEIAAVIIEPIAGNMGVVKAEPLFLKELRRICDECQAILIFDEVITGFRIAYGGAAEYYGIQPDMACFGKIIGAGMSVGAYGGKRELMEMVSPCGDVYQAGTLAGNPLAMHLGCQQLMYLKAHPEVYREIDEYTKQLASGIRNIIDSYNLPYHVQYVGSLLTIFFTPKQIYHYDDVSSCDEDAFQRYFHLLLEEGVLCAPSQYEAMFIGSAHTQEELDSTLKAMRIALIGSHV